MTRDEAVRAIYPLAPNPIRGDLANLYDAGDVLVKIPRDPGASDLMEREAVALRQLADRGHERFLPYVPVLVESCWHRDEATGVRRRVNALGRLDGFHSLAQVQAAYPDGVDPRDVAWMWRRLLVVLGFAHRAGVLHGGVLPEHVLIHPAEHGLVLVDWCCAVTEEHPGRVPAMVHRHTDLYPPEVPARHPAAPGTDVFMATRCVALLMGDRAPKPLRLFVRGCLPSNQRRRPQDAWRLLAELDELLERLYGRRRFRPFTLPRR